MDPRIPIVAEQVAAWTPTDERGVRSKRRTLELLDVVSQPFSREFDKRHFTGSAVVLSTAGTLLHLHKMANIWVGPGGHIDGDEFPWDAAVRETWEETGIKAWQPFSEPVLADVDVHDTPNDHVHFDLRYVLVALPDDPAPPPGESPDVDWFPNVEAVLVTDASYRESLLRAHGLKVELPR